VPTERDGDKIAGDERGILHIGTEIVGPLWGRVKGSVGAGKRRARGGQEPALRLAQLALSDAPRAAPRPVGQALRPGTRERDQA